MIDEGGQSQHMLPLKGQAGQTAEKAEWCRSEMWSA